MGGGLGADEAERQARRRGPGPEGSGGLAEEELGPLETFQDAKRWLERRRPLRSRRSPDPLRFHFRAGSVEVERFEREWCTLAGQASDPEVSPYTVMRELGHRDLKLIERTYGHLRASATGAPSWATATPRWWTWTRPAR